MKKPARRRREKREVDWFSVSERLAALTLGKRLETNEQEVLKTRAERLAHRAASLEPLGELNWLIFHIEHETFLIDGSRVVQVLRSPEITALPTAPTQLRGLTNFRGELLPVFDLASLMLRARATMPTNPWLIVLGRNTPELGIVASSIGDFERLDLNAILPPPSDALDARVDFVRGVTKEAVMVLDGEALLRDPQTFIDGAEAISVPEAAR